MFFCHFSYNFSVINGEFRQYRGTRDANSLMAFVEDKKWKEIEPVSSWKDPNSLQMGIVSYFFKLSHYLKEVNNVMLVDYGLPPWLTYVLFAIATILLGALLGLVLVSIIDLFFPPVPHTRTPPKTNIGSTDEDAHDVLEDDAGENDEEDDADEDDNEDGQPQSTSDGEKFSGSDSDESINEDKEQSNKPSQITKEKKGL